MTLRSLVPLSQRMIPALPEPSAFRSLHREVDRIFDDFARSVSSLADERGRGLVPSMDVAETDKEIEITAELPGLERKDVDITLEDDMLTIRGEKKLEAEEKEKNYHVNERSYGVFYRVLQLPPGIDPATVDASMSKGVLKIRIPKPAHSEAKKIEVKEAA